MLSRAIGGWMNAIEGGRRMGECYPQRRKRRRIRRRWITMRGREKEKKRGVVRYT